MGHIKELAKHIVNAERINQPSLPRIEQTHKEPILWVHLMILPKNSIAQRFYIHNGQNGKKIVMELLTDEDYYPAHSNEYTYLNCSLIYLKELKSKCKTI